MEKYSYSRINDFMTCPQKFYKKYICHLHPKKKAKPLALGACMATGIAKFREKGKINEAENAFIAKWEEDGQVLDIKKEADPLRSVERGLEILDEYALTYSDDPETTIEPEIKFDEEIAPGIRFRGRIDGITDAGGYAIIEDKTTSWLTETYLKQQRGSYQILWYMWVARRLGLFDISKSQKPKCMLNFLLIHKDKYEFLRQTIPKTNKEIDQSFNRLISWINLIEICKQKALFPKQDMATCLKWGGCEYLPLRNAIGTIYDSLLKNEYEIREPSK